MATRLWYNVFHCGKLLDEAVLESLWAREIWRSDVYAKKSIGEKRINNFRCVKEVYEVEVFVQ